MSQREEIESHCDRLRADLDPAGGHKARGAVLARMLMAYPMQRGMSEASAEARADAYRVALDDMPAWAIAGGIRLWHRGEAGEHNYDFAPSPAVLRNIVQGVLKPYENALARCEEVLSAVSLDRAMDPKPIERRNALVPRLRSV